MSDFAPRAAGRLVDDRGVWRQVLRQPADSVLRPALFLDRDGVIVEDNGHLSRVDDMRLIDDAAAVIALANQAGIAVVVVSNQSGIGRGLFGWEQFAQVQERLLERLAARGALADAVLACPHHPQARPPYAHSDHPSRKPNAGMILSAAEMLPIRREASWIVGDRWTDLAAGRSAGLAGGLHVATGHGSHPGERDAALALGGTGRFTVRVGQSVAAAASLVSLMAGVDAKGWPAGAAAQPRP
jgi:D-glycero-D-manno-heptose 1,7-bisphosphate phosphatase